VRILGERAREKTGARRVQHQEIVPGKDGHIAHHRLDPRGIQLRSDAVFNDCLEEVISRRCAEGIVPDLPVQVAGIPKKAAQRQTFEREDTLSIEKRREIGGEQYVEIQVKSPAFIDCKIAEKIVTLNTEGKSLESRVQPRELLPNECGYGRIIELEVFVVGVQQTDG
jgi:hypothetical protein